MRVLAIDPGTTESGWVLYDTETECVVHREISDNCDLLHYMEVGDFRSGQLKADHMAIEMVASYGMPVGASVFETCCWIGKFECAFAFGHELDSRPSSRIYRKDVKLHLCLDSRAKDANIRQALIDRFSGGQGKRVAIGLKASPGPLYGFKSHMWAALAVAVTWADKEG